MCFAVWYVVESEQATICLPYSLKNGALIWAMFRCLVRGGIRTGHSLSHSLQDEHGLANSSEPREGAILLTCEAFSFFFLFSSFSLLSHHPCHLQRDCSPGAHHGIPTPSQTQDPFHISGPTTKGPQEMSDHHWYVRHFV